MNHKYTQTIPNSTYWDKRNKPKFKDLSPGDRLRKNADIIEADPESDTGGNVA